MIKNKHATVFGCVEAKRQSIIREEMVVYHFATRRGRTGATLWNSKPPDKGQLPNQACTHQLRKTNLCKDMEGVKRLPLCLLV